MPRLNVEINHVQATLLKDHLDWGQRRPVILCLIDDLNALLMKDPSVAQDIIEKRVGVGYDRREKCQ